MITTIAHAAHTWNVGVDIEALFTPSTPRRRGGGHIPRGYQPCDHHSLVAEFVGKEAPDAGVVRAAIVNVYARYHITHNVVDTL